MQPNTSQFRETENTSCTDCSAPLETGRKLRCNRCIAAAESAVREAGTEVVRPSDVTAARMAARPDAPGEDGGVE